MKKVLYILGKLTDVDIDWMIEAGRRRTVPAGAVLIAEGRPIEDVSIIVSGSVQVATRSQPGKALATLGVGEVLGELSFLDSRPPAASATAQEPTQVLDISRASLTAKLEADLGFAARFYRALGTFLAARLRATVAQVGYDSSAPLSDDVEYEDELDPELLGEVSLAGSRFEWMLRRLRGE